jgi:hypothetical protein
MSLDLEKARREQARWLILQALDSGRPIGAGEAILLSALQQVIADFTQHELRRELDYLEDRALVVITGKDKPAWHAELTRHGVDIVEYTIDVEPGIARPPKYW